MELVQSKLKHINLLLNRAIQLQKRFEYIYSTLRPDLLGPYIMHIANIKNAMSELKNINEQTAPMKIGELIGICDNAFATMVKSLPLFNIMEETNASNTYILTTVKEIHSFEEYYNIYKHEPEYTSIHKWIIKKLVVMAPQDVEIDYNNHVAAVATYAAYLQYMFDTKNITEHQQFYDMLERAKTASLIPPNYKFPPAPSKRVMPMQRFGIIPVRQHLTINELICLYFGCGSSSATESSIDDFITGAKAINLNVLVVTNITTFPIEYNIQKLINPVDANPFITEPTAGLNKKIMERFSTIRSIETKSNSFGYKHKEYKHKHGCKWIMVRTINGEYWDAMSNQQTVDSKSSFKYNLDTLSMPESTIQLILRGPSPRIDIYQQQKNSIFKKYLHKPQEIESEIKVDNATLIDTIINRITGRIINYVDTSLLPLPTTPIELEKAINDPMFIEIINAEMLKSYAECGVDIELPIDELVGSFIADVDNVVMVQFARNLKMNMIENGPKPQFFSMYTNDTLKTRLYNLFVDIIKKSVISTIRSKENIYEKLLIKNGILKILNRFTY